MVSASSNLALYNTKDGASRLCWTSLSCSFNNPQHEKTPMEQYIVLDVHAASCTLAVISQKGRKLKDPPVEINGQAPSKRSS